MKINSYHHRWLFWPVYSDWYPAYYARFSRGGSHMRVVHLDEITKEYLKSSKMLVSAQYIMHVWQFHVPCIHTPFTCTLPLSHSPSLSPLPLFSLPLTHTHTNYFTLLWIDIYSWGESQISVKRKILSYVCGRINVKCTWCLPTARLQEHLLFAESKRMVPQLTFHVHPMLSYTTDSWVE